MFWAWRDRVLDLKRDIRLRHIVIFKNHGAAAGASLEHAHSQLIALPIVPREMSEELEGAKRHHQHQRALRVLRHHPAGNEGRHARDCRVGRFRGAGAVRAAVSRSRPGCCPKRHRARFEEATPGEFASLARMLKDTLRRMNVTLLTPPYNLIVHSAPLQDDAGRRSITGTSRSCRS